jgi:uncharacterized protein (TIGR00369 family)
VSRMLDQIQAMIRGEVPPAPVLNFVGMQLVSAEPGAAVVELRSDERHTNPMGTIHGGILCDIADAAMGIAYACTLEEGESFTTLELKINFLRPHRAGKLVATSRIVNSGRTVGLLACDVRDERERLIAHATSTCLTLRGEAGAGR